MPSGGTVVIDPRAGSRDLVTPLREAGVRLRVGKLAFGDVAIPGHGPSGGVLALVEHKKLLDLLQAIGTKRLQGHQIPGMRRQAQYVVLLVEGIYKPGPDGELLYSRYGEWLPATSRMTYAQLEGVLLSLRLCAGVHVVRCGSRVESVAWIAELVRWLAKPWESHRSHTAVYVPSPEAGSPVPLWEPSLAHKVASVLPGLGAVRAEAAAGRFGTTERLVTATVKQWQGVPGVGKTIAEHIYRRLRQE
jgi:ERCC4-type nuclease